MMANDLKQKNKDLNEQRNKYLFREKCFLCHKDNPNPQDMSSDEPNESGSRNDDDVKHTEIIRLFGLNPNKKLKKFPLWMCSDCKKNCENEEKKSRLLKMLGKNMPHNNLDFFNIEIKKPLDDDDVDNAKVKMPSEVLFTDQTCSCKGCKDRRYDPAVAKTLNKHTKKTIIYLSLSKKNKKARSRNKRNYITRS
jgi:hypothetical protein